jgi:hypothetical protein
MRVAAYRETGKKELEAGITAIEKSTPDARQCNFALPNSELEYRLTIVD